MGMVGRWGDRQQLADRLDPIRTAVIVDERDQAELVRLLLEGECRTVSADG